MSADVGIGEVTHVRNRCDRIHHQGVGTAAGANQPIHAPLGRIVNDDRARIEAHHEHPRAKYAGRIASIVNAAEHDARRAGGHRDRVEEVQRLARTLFIGQPHLADEQSGRRSDWKRKDTERIAGARL